MSDVPKERREKLRCACAAWESERPHDPVAHISTYELRTLLDMADERDQLRSLLIRVQMNGRVPKYLYNEIDAALEGNDED